MEYQYVNIREVLSRILRHPLLQELTLEGAVQYAVDFLNIVGMPRMFQDRQVVLDIHHYRAALPCDLIEIIMVKDCRSGKSLRSTTDVFYLEDKHHKRIYDLTYKTQGSVIYTSFEEGKIEIAYRAIPVDKEGFPMLPDVPVFLKALELYIKQEYFTILFDMQKINNAVLANTQQQYAWAVGQLNSEMTRPSLGEMESITNIMTSALLRTNEFSDGFIKAGNKEFLKDK